MIQKTKKTDIDELINFIIKEVYNCFSLYTLIVYMPDGLQDALVFKPELHVDELLFYPSYYSKEEQEAMIEAKSIKSKIIVEVHHEANASISFFEILLNSKNDFSKVKEDTISIELDTAITRYYNLYLLRENAISFVNQLMFGKMAYLTRQRFLITLDALALGSMTTQTLLSKNGRGSCLRKQNVKS